MGFHDVFGNYYEIELKPVTVYRWDCGSSQCEHKTKDSAEKCIKRRLEKHVLRAPRDILSQQVTLRDCDIFKELVIDGKPDALLSKKFSVSAGTISNAFKKVKRIALKMGCISLDEYQRPKDYWRQNIALSQKARTTVKDAATLKIKKWESDHKVEI